jgi:predicted permease
MNQAAWSSASGVAPGAISALLISIAVMLLFLILGKVILALFENVVHLGMSRERAFRYALRAVMVVIIFTVIFR